ncbi:pantoate--beta-alanine ligase [Campylobacter sp. MIT 21-1685]|uniref:pantoate--beta-alanine ligase n=1 Tax=unclassified Campylobacter TaxID=2593542 RepID=UPI00224B98A2|nr:MULTISPECIES: pantoate--beta-alanine ligase [unclassified Campylobacter]MCX2682390.1 pantoate--beta-alanine ligase [Campylobacter sp. MIT 21-1684]MCX2750670.1 pantoate--beta-alanine ligase [Campylobacter sp. MIT 21-1682]MCX2806782.1 pantoate--beta-alanine ligase [Campylobacter sp. MIT 21-1685]
MQIITEIQTMKQVVSEWKKQNFSIAYVPTMGYLHQGHKSLIQKARSKDKVVVSIFINPLQFGKNEDFAKYPKDLQRDRKLCEEAFVDVVFHPNALQMYPQGFCSYVDIKDLGDELCGISRPEHFRGVCTVLTKFFNIIQPDTAYFGQKDAQQCAIIKALVRDLNMPLEIESCPIIREDDGLAKSSRNSYLSKEERKAAAVLSRAIFLGQDLVKKGEKKSSVVLEAMRKELESEPMARIDYLKIVDYDTMKQTEMIHTNTLCALAVFIGKTRLIDNFLV